MPKSGINSTPDTVGRRCVTLRKSRATCGLYEISRLTFYTWLHRFETPGEAGVRDGSEASQPADDQDRHRRQVVCLRQYCRFEPRKLKAPVALPRHCHWPVGVSRILKGLELNRLPIPRR